MTTIIFLSFFIGKLLTIKVEIEEMSEDDDGDNESDKLKYCSKFAEPPNQQKTVFFADFTYFFRNFSGLIIFYQFRLSAT